MNESLLKMYNDAVQARSLVQQLPDGLREHAELFEKMCLEDLQGQQSNATEIIKPILTDIAKKALPVILNLAVSAGKKYLPHTVLTSLGTIAGYLVAMLQK